MNNQLSPNYNNKALCGAGVTYKFCEVLDDELGIELAHNFIDLAALGEIADVMDKTDTEVNYIMMEGLKNIKNVGFQTLIEAQAYSLKEKAVYPYPGLTTIDVAFYIAPLINAVIRVGTLEEKKTLFYCFIEPDKQLPSTKRGAAPGDTEKAAEQAARIAKNAKARQDRIKEKALEIINERITENKLDENNIIIVEINDDDKIPNEMTGLIAQNIVSLYSKPCFIVRRDKNDVLRGSLRNNGNCQELPDMFEMIAGHSNAAGLGLPAKNVPILINYMNSKYSKDSFDNCYTVDYILDSRDDNRQLLTALAKGIKYYGNGIDEPKIVITDISLASIFVMGTNKDSAKISYNGVDYVRFKDLDFIEVTGENKSNTLTVYGRVALNTWGGRTTIQVLIEDYEVINKSKYDF